VARLWQWHGSFNDHQVGFAWAAKIKQLLLAQLEKAIVTKQHFSKKE